MKKIFSLRLVVAFVPPARGQKIFHKIDLENNAGVVSGIVQDHLGYIWFTSEGIGLIKYDGSGFITYTQI